MSLPPSRMLPRASSGYSPSVCVAAVLGDAERRVAVLGGREGMPRSLGSVYGGSVTRFLGGSLRGVVSRVIDTPGVIVWSCSVAVSRDGTTLLVADSEGESHTIHEFAVADGLRRRVIGGKGKGPLQFDAPAQVWVASDDFVFVVDCGNHRVQVLTPRLDFHAFVGVGQLTNPAGVCANADVVVVSECYPVNRIAVFDRGDGTLRRRFGRPGWSDGCLDFPNGLCFLPGDRHVAVADLENHRVSVFSVDGDFIRHVGVDVLYRPSGVACSAFGELVVAVQDGVVVFSVDSEVVHVLKQAPCCGGVVILRGTIVAHHGMSDDRLVVID